VPCAHQGCTTDATLKLHLPTGWANVCRPHAEQHWQREADQFNRVNGLDTREKQLAFIAGKLASLKLKGLPMREPGQDDEERVA
jgi:hypothetical protein